MLLNGRKRQEAVRLTELPLSEIFKSPDQPRTSFDEYEIKSLSESIKENGLLQPISVRRQGGGYCLIAGERRVRAARLAGLKVIPAIIHETDDRTAAVFTLLENLQRSDLSPFEEAEGIKRLIGIYGVSQCEAAERLGIAQSTLSNKLRILKLSQSQRNRIEAAGLSERHARVLLKVPQEQRDTVLDRILADELNVKEAERLVDELLSPTEKQEPCRKSGIGDVRLFANSLSKIVDTMIKAGYTAKTRKSETDSYIEYTVRIDKKSSQLRLI